MLQGWTKRAVALSCLLAFGGCGSDDSNKNQPGAAGASGAPSQGGNTNTSGSNNASSGSAGLSAAGTTATTGGAPSQAGAAGVGADAGAGGSDAGAGGTAGGGGSAGEPAHTGFTAYGKVVLVLDRSVDANEVSVTVSPLRPADLQVKKITQLAPARIELELSTYHLPIDYTFTVKGDGFEIPISIPGENNGSRIAFLSKANGTGDLKSWPAATGAETARKAGDRICQTEADQAGLKGTFRAFIGSDEIEDPYDALCQSMGLSGTWAENCKQSEAIKDTAPFLSTLGVPIVNGIEGIAAAEWLTPVRGWASGEVLGGSSSIAWTGSSESGRMQASDCVGWSSGSKADFGVLTRNPHEQLVNADFTLECDVVRRLICMQSGDGFFPQATLHQRTGKEIFVTSSTHIGLLEVELTPETKLQGVAAADRICQDAAKDAEFTAPEQFIAWISDSQNDALCRLIASGGKRGTDACGLGSLPSTGPWVRHDGFLIAEHVTQLVSGNLSAPILFDETGAPQASSMLWTGTKIDGTAQPNTCNDWAVKNDNSGSGGIAAAQGIFWTQFFGGGCLAQNRLVCLRR